VNYWSDLFTPETFEAFARSDRAISGFRELQRLMAEKVRIGDEFLCYMVRMSRWIGVLDVLAGPSTDNTPIFVAEDDPFVVRFRVTTAVWPPLEKTVPIHEPEVCSRLTFARDVQPGGYLRWTPSVGQRNGLNSGMEGRPASYFRREIVNAIPDLVRKDCTGRSLPHDLPADRIVFH
jgi:hypothetical protein